MSKTSKFTPGSCRRMRIPFDVTLRVDSHPDTNFQSDEDARSKAAVDEERSKLKNLPAWSDAKVSSRQKDFTTFRTSCFVRFCMISNGVDTVLLCWHASQCPWHRRGRHRDDDAGEMPPMTRTEEDIGAELAAVWAATCVQRQHGMTAMMAGGAAQLEMGLGCGSRNPKHQTHQKAVWVHRDAGEAKHPGPTDQAVVFFVHSVGLSPFSVWPGALALTLRGHPDGCTPLVFTRAQLSPL